MGTFTLDLTKFAEKAKIAPGLVIKKVIFDLYANIAATTPVDTGRARGGWQIGTSPGSHTDAKDLTPTGTKNLGWGELKKIDSLDTNKDGIVGYIYNNVQYIKVLEDGRGVRDGQMRGSEQAPRGMVKINLVALQLYIKRAVASL